MRLTELAAYLSTHPEATGTEIDDAMWPNRAVHDHSRVRDSSLAGLGSWLGPDETPQGGLVAARTIASDWSLWQGLVPADPSTAGTEHPSRPSVWFADAPSPGCTRGTTSGRRRCVRR